MEAGLVWQNWLILGSMVTDMAASMLIQWDPKSLGKSLINPADYAFAIWAIIYLLGLVFSVAQMLPSYRQHEITLAVAPYFAVVHFCQALWYVCVGWKWDQEAELLLVCYTVVCVLGLVKSDAAAPKVSTADWWLLRSNLSFHGAWLIVASFVGLNLALCSFKASIAVQVAEALLSLALVTAASSAFSLLYFKPDAVVPLVAAWALVGIYQELSSTSGPWSKAVIDLFRVLALALAAASLGLAALALQKRVAVQSGADRSAFVSIPGTGEPRQSL